MTDRARSSAHLVFARRRVALATVLWTWLLTAPALGQAQPGLPPELEALRERAWSLAQRAERADLRGLAARVYRDWLAVAPGDTGFHKARGDTRDPRLRRWVAADARRWQDGTPDSGEALSLNREHRAWRDDLVRSVTEVAVNAIQPQTRAPLLDALRALGAPLPARLAELRSVTVDPADLRLGWHVQGSLPTWALAFRSGPFDLWLLDLDGDGRVSPGDDGLAFAGGGFVVRLPPVLLLPEGQCRLVILADQGPHGRLRLSPVELDLPFRLQYEASALLELRLRAGTPLVLLDAAASRDAAAHLDYLALNRLTDGRTGLGIHQQDPDLPGASAASAEAGRDSCLYPRIGSLSSALLDWYATAYHGVPLVSPTTRTVGVAFAHRCAALYPRERTPVLEPFLHPQPGAHRIPTRFNARGEVPSPAPGTTYAIGCGFPVYVELPRALWSLPPGEVTLTSPEGQVQGYVSSPASPAAPDVWPTNSGLLLFVPERPLAYGVTYQARFTLEGGPTWTWSFTTTDG